MKRMVVELIATTSTSCGGAVGTKQRYTSYLDATGSPRGRERVGVLIYSEKTINRQRALRRTKQLSEYFYNS